MPYKKHRLEVYDKFDGRCAYCGEHFQITGMHIDHIISQLNFKNFVANKIHIPNFLEHLTVSDLHHKDNLFPACRVCNGWKSTYHLELFRHELEEQIKRLNARSANYRIAKKYGFITENKIKVIFHFETVNHLKK